MTEDRYEYEFPIGAIDPEHDVFRCSECDGEGQFETQLPARITDLEPRYATQRCDDCDGHGFAAETECSGCGQVIAGAIDGVGMVERRLGRRPAVWVYCGACAWVEVVLG